jgi:Na+-transporting NADH:ubiquinone oxidoreductase subunit NqrE
MIKHLNQMINKQITQQQNLRELARLTFLNLMSANGVMAKTIIRNYKQKQQRESYDNLRQCKNIISKG